MQTQQNQNDPKHPQQQGGNTPNPAQQQQRHDTNPPAGEQRDKPATGKPAISGGPRVGDAEKRDAPAQQK